MEVYYAWEGFDHEVVRSLGVLSQPSSYITIRGPDASSSFPAFVDSPSQNDADLSTNHVQVLLLRPTGASHLNDEHRVMLRFL